MNESDFDTFEDAVTKRRAELPVAPYLFLVLECDRPTAGGARYALADVDEVVIGRSSSRKATLQVDGGAKRLSVRVPGRSMSSTHAKLTRTSEGYRLEDLRSTNGSFVNAKRVQAAPVKDGDVIEVGHTLFVLREALATPAATAPIWESEGEVSGDENVGTLLPKLAADQAELAKFARSHLPILLLGQ
ncbi:MAG TPA: FHA domain-containing protein, partial [Polyangiaceae bacterium]|nr:FHA domain-containing protein [Polyangiaceae bacterium]